MNDNIQKITNLIYEIRGVQVMLDSDLAKLYRCKNGVKEINNIVKKNKEKFPERFMFKLEESEFNRIQDKYLLSTKRVSKRSHFAFTEQGIAMLAAILNTNIASEISVAIIDAFDIMRKYISNELYEQRYFYNQTLKNTDDIKLLQESFKKLEAKEINNEIYFNGQIYDAYSKIIDIFKMAKKELIIIDGYTDKLVLDMIREVKVPVLIICKKNKKLRELDIKRYNKQYHNLHIKYDNTYHDRYFIIDKEKIYHCGASINQIGSKTFSINLLLDKEIINLLLNKISKKNWVIN